MAQQTSNLGRSILTTAAAIVIVIAGLHAGKPLLVPFLIAVFLSVLSLPAVEFMRRKNVPKGVAVLTTVIVGFCLLLSLGLFVAREVQAFAVDLKRSIQESEEGAWYKNTELDPNLVPRLLRAAKNRV